MDGKNGMDPNGGPWTGFVGVVGTEFCTSDILLLHLLTKSFLKPL